MSADVTLVPIRSLILAWATLAHAQTKTTGRSGSQDLRVLLDCPPEFDDYFRTAAGPVTYVHDREDADVSVCATPVPTRGSDRHYQVSFIGAGRFKSIEASARVRIPHGHAARAAREGRSNSAHDDDNDSNPRIRRPTSLFTR